MDTRPCQHQVTPGRLICGYPEDASMHEGSKAPAPPGGRHKYQPELNGVDSLQEKTSDPVSEAAARQAAERRIEEAKKPIPERPEPEKHKRAEQLDRESQENIKAALERAKEPIPEQRARGAIQAEITVTLFKDGNFQVNGPWDNRITFEGMWSVATDVIKNTFLNLQMQAAQQEPRIQKASFWDRKQMEKLKKGGL